MPKYVENAVTARRTLCAELCTLCCTRRLTDISGLDPKRPTIISDDDDDDASGQLLLPYEGFALHIICAKHRPKLFQLREIDLISKGSPSFDSNRLSAIAFRFHSGSNASICPCQEELN